MCIRDREVALLVADLVAPVALLLARAPRRLAGADLVEAGVRLTVEAHLVEDEELGLRAEVRRVRDAGGAQVPLRLDRNVPRIAAVWLLGDGVGDVADEAQCRICLLYT